MLLKECPSSYHNCGPLSFVVFLVCTLNFSLQFAYNPIGERNISIVTAILEFYHSVLLVQSISLIPLFIDVVTYQNRWVLGHFSSYGIIRN
jgi:hypothetical protein